MHLYERELSVANGQALTFPANYARKLFPIGFPPAGKLLHLAVREVGSTNMTYTARLYDRDIGYYIPITTYVPTGDPVTSAVFTFDTPATTNNGTTIATATLLPAADGFYADVVWRLGGLDRIVPNQFGAPIYPGQGFTVPHVSFTSPSGSDVTGTPAAGLLLPTSTTQFNRGALQLYYMPPDATVAPKLTYPSIIIDETLNNITSLTVGTPGDTAWYSTGMGKAYQNREGSFTVPVRKVYLEIDVGGGSIPTADCVFEVELACEIGNELN